MRQYILIITILVLFLPDCFSQRAIEVNYEKDNQGNFNFYCINNQYSKYILDLNFTEFINLKSNSIFPYKGVISPGRTNLFTIKPDNANNPTSFKYLTNYRKGCINPVINPDFTYLLPSGKGKEIEVLELRSRTVNEKDIQPKDWYTLGIKFNKGDTIFAARRGVVCETSDTSKLIGLGNDYLISNNYIEICHDDCSFGRYQMFRRLLVTVGQNVEAGDPIGIAGGKDVLNFAIHTFSVSYNYDKPDSIKNADGTDRIIRWAFVPMVFLTTESKSTKLIPGKKYVGEYSESIITQEMTKNKSKNGRKPKA